MNELLFITLGALISYNIFHVALSIFNDIKARKSYVYDYRDNDEKIIAGEDTSEVALDYLKKL
jgi:hypothetical protein